MQSFRLTKMRATVVAVVCASAVAVPLLPGSVLTATAASVVQGPSSLGVYRGAPPDLSTKIASYTTLTGVAPSIALDFTDGSTWDTITSAYWQMGAWRDRPERLELSVSMLPMDSTTSLEACAAGSYNSRWATLARNLVAYSLADTIVRPGWEFNGNWYRWAAATKPAAFAGCFRNVVTTMRAATGQQFAFDWSPANTLGAFPAEQAWPGDAYVDIVGVDAYDQCWSPGTYPYPTGATASQILSAQQKCWAEVRDGDHGLTFWRDFAAAHGKRLALPEWGVFTRPDGHGGGDNPYYIEAMSRFLVDNASRLSHQSYFDFDASDGQHRLSESTRFPKAAAKYVELFGANAPAPTTTATTTSPAPTTTTATVAPAPTTSTTTTTAPTTTTTVAPAPTTSTTTSTTTTTAPTTTTTVAPDPVSNTDAALWVSTSPSRTGAVPLAGQKLSGLVYVFVTGGSDLRSVSFRVDDPTAAKAPYHTELEAPWDLVGTSTSGAMPLDVATLGNGGHSVSAAASGVLGSTTLSGTFSTGGKRTDRIVARVASSTVTLADQVLREPTVIGVLSSGALTRVTYSVDGKTVKVRRDGKAHGYDPRSLRPGRHLMVVKATGAASTRTLRTTFRTPQVKGAGTVVVRRAGSTKARSLQGRTLRGKVRLSLTKGREVRWVRSSLDGAAWRTDLVPARSTRGVVVDTRALRLGRHSLRVWVQTNRGVAVKTLTFTVRR